MTLVASLATGTPVTLEMKGIVRLPRGFYLQHVHRGRFRVLLGHPWAAVGGAAVDYELNVHQSAHTQSQTDASGVFDNRLHLVPAQVQSGVDRHGSRRYALRPSPRAP